MADFGDATAPDQRSIAFETRPPITASQVLNIGTKEESKVFPDINVRATSVVGLTTGLENHEIDNRPITNLMEGPHR